MSKPLLGLLLVLPALAVIAFLFILPLIMSAVGFCCPLRRSTARTRASSSVIEKGLVT